MKLARVEHRERPGDLAVLQGKAPGLLFDLGNLCLRASFAVVAVVKRERL
jgi:hypothetical protein